MGYDTYWHRRVGSQEWLNDDPSDEKHYEDRREPNTLYEVHIVTDDCITSDWRLVYTDEKGQPYEPLYVLPVNHNPLDFHFEYYPKWYIEERNWGALLDIIYPIRNWFSGLLNYKVDKLQWGLNLRRVKHLVSWKDR